MINKEEPGIPKNVPKPIPVYDEIDEYETIDPCKEADLDYLQSDWTERY